MRMLSRSRSRALPGALLVALPILAGCPAEEEPPPPPPTVLVLQVTDAVTGAPIPAARVLLGGRWRTVGEDGRLETELAAGRYELAAQAPGHLSLPEPFRPAPVAEVIAERTTERRLRLEPRPGDGGTGTISGQVLRDGLPVEGALVVAVATLARSARTDGDGRYAILGVPAAAYTVTAWRAGHTGEPRRLVNVGEGALVTGIDLELEAITGARIEGSLGTATATSSTQVIFTSPETGEPIPGLAVGARYGETWFVDGVPPGRFAVRTALERDGVVEDPEPIRTEGLPQVEVVGSEMVTIALPVAPALALLEPTETASVAAPPLFRWAPVAGADFYVIEVRDAAGRNLWGGFDAGGIWRFTILAPDTTARYEGPALTPGARYHWRVWAARRDPVVISAFTLIAASEALAGELRVAD